MTMSAKHSAAACVFLAAAMVAGCQSAQTQTQVLILVDAQPGVRAHTDKLRLHVESHSGAGVLWSGAPFTPKWPVKIAIAPKGGDASRSYVVTADSMDAHDALVAQARVLSGFVSGELRYVYLLLEDACLGKQCTDTAQTCHAGACVSAQVAADTLSTHPPTPLSGGKSDAGLNPAASDAGAGCVDVQGTRYCQCNTGYEGDGASCALVKCDPPPASPTNGSVSTPNGTTYSKTATYSCKPGYELSSNAPRTCQASGSWDGTAPSCGGINECAGATVCTVDYPCQDLTPFYTCQGQFADWSPTYSASAFTVNSDGTVKDSRSGLVWQRTLPATYTGCSGRLSVGGDTCSLAEAKAYCAGLAPAGTGWRLPTKAELESIVDDSRYNPAIDPTAFPGTPSDYFWSSSPYVGSAGFAWGVLFDFGFSNYSGPTSTYRVRCVR
jgi:hypothetical protein